MSRSAQAFASISLAFVFGLCVAGCGKSEPTETGSTDSPISSGDNSGLQLPAGFKTVELPLEKRKDVFKEAHDIRALAVQEANLELPMDEASLPHLDTKAFDKRVADHMAIIKRILGGNLPPLAEKYKISVADIEKIEEEANKLRWTPPQDPVFKPKATESGEKPTSKDERKAEKKDESPSKNADSK